MFYILKMKLVSTRMGYIFRILPDGQPLRHNDISRFILSSSSSRKTNNYISVLERNPGYDSLYTVS
ncbi:hypothetical protein C0J52_13711 [Blattella germanica]|nr:hypothetical protein C0J52_13711 [Blattella germanica]